MSDNLAKYLYADEAECVNAMIENLDWNDARADAVFAKAKSWVETLRGKARKFGELEVFLQQYSLSTKEGLALMCLAEALLRVPDKKTANDLIKDKVVAAEWLRGVGDTNDWMVKAAGMGLSLSSATLQSLFARLGEPVIREAMAKAMQLMGSQFVLGRDIGEAMERANDYPAYRMSYDMLGEGARTAEDAEKYFESYRRAIDYVGKNLAKVKNERRPGISVKLSALHPRYEFAQKERCVPEITERLLVLARQAAGHNIALTVDAEESERLEISLDIIEAVLRDKSLSGWDDYGLAVQAYQKRCTHLIDHLVGHARDAGRRMQMRLVKGAYWDSEIKKAQLGCYPDYPVFTRKMNSDLSYLACSEKMLGAGDILYPMFATHNAHSIAAITQIANDTNCDFEFQRLHGMGEGLYDIVMQENPDMKVSVYAPVGPYSDLLPYLVRRLLENGANSSFVNKILVKRVPVDELVEDPVEEAQKHPTKRHTKIPMPVDLYGVRINSRGVDLHDEETVMNLTNNVQKVKNTNFNAKSIIKNEKIAENGQKFEVKSPANSAHIVGSAKWANADIIPTVFDDANKGYKSWVKTDVEIRAAAVDKFADLMEKHHDHLIGLCVYEAGKTMEDAHMEVREAIDFCRYYANQGRVIFNARGTKMPGPTGEENVLMNHGRGVFVCISPWNFPVAIFTGQIVAALVAGNAVVAKPAEQTSIIAYEVVKMMHEAGIPRDVLQLVLGDGSVGAAAVEHKDVGGVAFTGSTEVAKIIQRTLAQKEGPIVPLIAETGGLNAMIVDSSALPEQVVDDVVTSSFGAAGQRCSALRVLYLQEDIADKVIHMLKGAMDELVIGHPENLACDIGPVIDEDARGILIAHKKKLDSYAKQLAEAKIHPDANGTYFAPVAYEISSLKQLEREVFGPILHVIRYKAGLINDIIAEVNDSGYGLTFGVHSRIESFQEKLAKSMNVGNVYVNRSIIGAVVGTQPFGGMGLSGTGPKAGGPHYLHAFATEKVISIDTTAAGGNTSLVSLSE